MLNPSGNPFAEAARAQFNPLSDYDMYGMQQESRQNLSIHWASMQQNAAISQSLRRFSCSIYDDMPGPGKRKLLRRFLISPLFRRGPFD